LPTKAAPAISGAEVRANGSVEHEFNNATPTPASMTVMRPAMLFRPISMRAREAEANPTRNLRFSYTFKGDIGSLHRYEQ
jgi:hypothetical protein